MAKADKSMAVPQLRFLEFLDSPGWRPRPLSTFVSALDAGVSVNAGDRPATPAEIGVLKTSCVSGGVFELSENKVVLEPGEVERVTECVRRGTIIISRMNTIALVGANAYVESDAANIFLPDRLWAAKPAPDANMRFIAYTLGSDRGRGALSEIAAGSSGSMKNIAKSAVLGLLISVPESGEQQKITDCLTSLDEVIAAQGRKVEALKTHKRGLMQQLFPREGESLPRLRFSRFCDAPVWRENTLGKLCTSVSSGRDAADSEGTFDLYGSTRVIAKTSSGTYTGQLILVARVGANAGFLTKANGSFGVTDNTIVVALKDVGATDFIFYSLGSLGLNKLVFGSGQPLITGGQLKRIVVRLPDEPEQQRVSDCLAARDTQIAAESEKLEALKTHKKGLMQQLFPSPEEG